MAEKKTGSEKSRQIANISTVVMFLFICAVFILETFLAQMQINYAYAATVMIIAFTIIILILRSTVERGNLAFNIPFVLLLFYTSLVLIFDWNIDHFFILGPVFLAMSCIYSNFNRTLVFFIIQNILTGVLIFTGVPIGGLGVPLFTVLMNWAIFLFAGIIILILTRAATIHLNKALVNQQSFVDLLDTAENFVAMINEYNEVVYASRTLSQLGNTAEPLMVQGRPVLDLFPGRSLKIYAAKMLKEKDNYAEDWEFTLNGQKRYFKAASHGMRTGNALISLYDMTHLAERDEIAVMKDSMKIGLFFMDSNFVIQDHYSRYLEEMLVDTRLYGKYFTDVIADSVSANELNAIRDYFNMVLERTYDQEMLEDINPLTELHYLNSKTGDKKVFQFAFATVERGRGEVFLLVTVYDITARVELQQRLADEEARRQEEMQSLFELIQVEPGVFSDFMQDMEYEFETITSILKNDALTAHEALVKIYQSVHAIKSNAVILGLNIFSNKAHNLESNIKRLREMEGDVPFAEMLDLTMDIEKLTVDKEGFRDIIDKLQVYSGGKGGDIERQNVKVLVESLTRTAAKAAENMEKQIKFIADDIDARAIDSGPRRVIKEILMQLIRNSAVHGIELPDARVSKGKSETGTVKLSIKMDESNKKINIKLSDDGQGLDYKKIAQRALDNNLIKKEDADNRDALNKVIFSPGFSTADADSVHAGRGIGLNLVRDRIKEVSGNIKLRSEDDKGAVFLVTIPV